MVKKITSDWPPSKKWVMGIVALFIGLTAGGVLSYLSIGALKGYEISTVQANVKENKAEIKDIKEKTSKDIADIKDSTARTETKVEMLIKMVEEIKKTK